MTHFKLTVTISYAMFGSLGGEEKALRLLFHGGCCKALLETDGAALEGAQVEQHQCRVTVEARHGDESHALPIRS